MKDLLVFILTNLVDNPDQINVEETVDENGLVTLNATVAADDMGKVIGKGGKVINAIRQVVRIRAIKEGKRVTINVAEPGGADSRPATSEPQSSKTLSESKTVSEVEPVEPVEETPSE